MCPPSPRPPSSFRHGLAAGCLVLAGCLQAGCVTSMLANRMIRAPNLHSPPGLLNKLGELQPALVIDYYSLSLKVAVTPHPAEVAVAVLDPGNYKLKHELKVTASNVDFQMSFDKRDRTAAPVAPKGTIFLLHGVMMNKESMLHWGFFLAQKGYRVVLVDLRGHGQSTGDTIAYGAWEPADLTQVLDELTRRQFVAGRVGVLGVSYGGAIAIDWAARDPRLAAVIALEPFSDARKAVDEFAHALMPRLTAHIRPETMSAAFVLVAQRGHFDWEETDVLTSTRRLRTPILLFHGRNDQWISPAHSEKIKAAAPAGSQLRLGPGDHLTLSIRLAPIDEEVAAWFDQALAMTP